MQFEVRGLRQGVVETLMVDAASEDDARIKAQGLHVQILSIRPVQSLLRNRKFDLTLFSQELSELLDAGLSTVEALETLADREGAQTVDGHVSAELRTHLRQGLAFSAALEKMPQCFPPLYVGLIRAAERTSDLHGALGRYLEYSGRLDALRAKITSALIYPSILFVVGGGVIVFLMGFVVPRFASVYHGSGRQLPAMSAMLLEWGSFASQHRYLLASVFILVLTGAVITVVSAYRQGRIESLLGWLPSLQGRIRLFRLSRLYLTVGTLINGGMPIVQALQLSRDIMPGQERQHLDATIEALRRGESLTNALQRFQLTTAVSVRLLHVGEGTGRMGDLLIRAGRYHDAELGRWVERFTRTFEPVLMAVIGLLIGGIVILLYMPIFDLVGSLQ